MVKWLGSFQKNKMIKGKQGYIRIIEAFISILLVTTVLLVVINQGYIGKSDISEQVYRVQVSVLREVELDNQLRTDLLNANLSSGPIKWVDFESNGLGNVKTRVLERIPEYLTCVGKVCELDRICSLDSYQDKDIFAQAVAITAQGGTYSPRQLKLFCWTAE